MTKQETIKRLTDLMVTAQMAHFKGREIGVRVHEHQQDSGISIDLYNFEGDGEPVCEGLKPCKIIYDDGSTDIGHLFCMCYNPDEEETPLVFLFSHDEYGDGGDVDIAPVCLPSEALQNITQWLENAMVPAVPNLTPKQIKEVMDRWSGFCYNHPPYEEVILWMVGGSKQHILYNHFCSKFANICKNICNNDTTSAWIKFYRELDDKWAERLMEYVYCEWKKN